MSRKRFSVEQIIHHLREAKVLLAQGKTLVIDVTHGTVALQVNVRFTESTTEFCCERDIMTGEEI